MQIATIHKVQVGWVVIANARDGKDVVVNRLGGGYLASANPENLGHWKLTFSWVMESADTESSVTKTASLR